MKTIEYNENVISLVDGDITTTVYKALITHITISPDGSIIKIHSKGNNVLPLEFDFIDPDTASGQPDWRDSGNTEEENKAIFLGFIKESSAIEYESGGECPECPEIPEAVETSKYLIEFKDDSITHATGGFATTLKVASLQPYYRLIDNTGKISENLTLSVISNADSYDASGGAEYFVDRYPYYATNYNWKKTDGTISVRISGCDDSKYYRINIVSSRSYSGDNVTINVNGEEIVHEAKDDQGIIPYFDLQTSGGTIDVSVSSIDAGDFATLNMIELVESTDVIADTYFDYLWSYNDRVIHESNANALIVNRTRTQDLFKFYYDEGVWDNVKLLLTPEIGIEKREDSGLTYITKIYDLTENDEDATQTTEADQPRLKGIIAPNEKPALSNQSGESRYLSHPEISFASDEAWSITAVLNITKLDTGYVSLCGGTNTGIRINNQEIRVVGNDSAQSGSETLLNKIGKNSILHLIYNGTDNVAVYIDSSLLENISITSSFTFDTLFFGKTGVDYFEGTISIYSIQSGTLTPTQVTAEYNMLRALYPEIPSVQIGSQTWATSNFEAVATPLGNVIQEMQDASAVEKITDVDDREFNHNVDFSLTDAVITGGNLDINCATNNTSVCLKVFSGMQSGKWYRVTIVVSEYTSGDLRYRVGSSGNTTEAFGITGVGTYVLYKYTLNGPAFDSGFITIGSFVGKIDSQSIEQLGRAEATDLYNGLIAQGETEYDALKAAAMWAYYNNDPDYGASHGKLYNWFAIKLLQTDIDLFNTANPTTPYGVHLPTEAEVETLKTNLGGADIAGGKMKHQGDDYWSSNVGATNESGFTALGSGRVTSTGIFNGVGAYSLFWLIDESGTSGKYRYLTNDSAKLWDNNSVAKQTMVSCRMIKDAA
jgi:uncharacterized protein (TIGR02145 family)